MVPPHHALTTQYSRGVANLGWGVRQSQGEAVTFHGLGLLCILFCILFYTLLSTPFCILFCTLLNALPPN